MQAREPAVQRARRAGRRHDGDAWRCRNRSAGAKAANRVASARAAVERAQQRRQQRHARSIRNHHAASRDQSQLRESAIARRQERQEARRRRGRRQRQGRAHPFGGVDQRSAQVAVLVAFHSIADAELNGEIGTQPDEQHGKRHRKRVQRAYQDEAERGRDRKADAHRDGDSRDDPRRSRRQPQDQEHDRRGDHAVAQCPLAQRRELLIGNRDRPGQPHLRLEGRGKRRIIGRGADGSGCRAAGLERVVVEDRPSLDDAAQFFRLGRGSVQQHLPRERRRSIGKNGIERVAGHIQRPGQAVQGQAADLHALQHRRE